ncbi:AI-2E family transporter [uncultured Sphingomonas sp.]|uniref:AI-2E family transporter n=1 Tax=uncultured Sphingomonas sp. TaxID=158754 RepID=UPI0035CB423F
MDPTTPPRARGTTIARGVVVGALGVLGLWVVLPFLPALVWAVVVAIAADPLVKRTEARFPGRRGWIALGFTPAFAALVLAPIVAGIAQAAREAHDLAGWIATARASGLPPPAWLATLPAGSAEATAWWQANLADPVAAAALFHNFNHALWNAQARLIGVGLLHRTVIFAFTLLALFFLIRDRDGLVAQCRVAGDRLIGAAGERIARQAALSVRGTIDGLVLVGIGEGAAMILVYLVLGVPHPLLLGVATAIAAMIPFGAAVMFVIAALLLLAQGAAGAAIAVMAIGLTVVGIADHLVRPVLIGSATRLPFLWVLIGILGGVEAFGLLGLFVGPATMAVLVMLWREFVEGKPQPAASDDSSAA